MQDLPDHLAERTRRLTPDRKPTGPYILYWMHHAQRVNENPALDVARHLGAGLGLPVLVWQGLGGAHRFNSDRHHFFILQSAREVAAGLAGLDVGFHFRLDGGPGLRDVAGSAAAVVVEDMPVPPFVRWQQALVEAIEAPVYKVDARCIVPMPLVRERYDRAFAFRRATRELYEARVEAPWPELQIDATRPWQSGQSYDVAGRDDAQLLEDIARCPIDHGVGPVWHTPGGTAAALRRWQAFREHGLATYHRRRNDAAVAFPEGVSRLSPYLHYGCISPLQVAREAAQSGGDGARKYLDELFVWRELAHNFCAHTRELETLSVLPGWARETLAEHAADSRPARYSWERLARARTGDRVWDTAQRSLLIHGELHNNVRMTWAKQLLQWTPDPATALGMLIDLNHRYALDGNDPNSYGGLLWALGRFDRPFPPPRPVLGTVRGRDTATHARRLDVARWAARIERPSGRRLAVGVVGAGVSGLAAARVLADHGHEVTVIDKGRGVGGRCSTRRDEAGRFDHGAQYFTADDPNFGRHVEAWRDEGWVARWPGRLVRLAGRDPTPVEDGRERLVAMPGMSALSKHLARDLTVHTATRAERLVREGEAWAVHLADQRRAVGFDAVLITAPPAQAVALLATAGVAAPAPAPAMAPCWALMLAFDGLDAGFDAAQVDDEAIAWIGVDSSKPGRDDTGPARVVVHATPAFSAAHLEAEPDEIAQRLTGRLRERLSAWPAPARAVAHRWRYARAVPGDAASGVVATDASGLWLAGDAWRGRSRIEDAWLSGVAAAGRILAFAGPTKETQA